jgi:hypothetical protein
MPKKWRWTMHLFCESHAGGLQSLISTWRCDLKGGAKSNVNPKFIEIPQFNQLFLIQHIPSYTFSIDCGNALILGGQCVSPAQPVRAFGKMARWRDYFDVEHISSPTAHLMIGFQSLPWTTKTHQDNLKIKAQCAKGPLPTLGMIRNQSLFL